MNFLLRMAAFICCMFVLAPQIASAFALRADTVIALTNQSRASAGLSPLVESASLDRAAQAKADDMAARGYFSHVDPEGKPPWYWFTKSGYYYLSAGENLAYGLDDPLLLEGAWMNSPGHRANILGVVYSATGVGIASGSYRGEPAVFVVQFFAQPAPVAQVRNVVAGPVRFLTAKTAR